MKIDNSETKTGLIQRLKRIEGQVRGVQTMLAEERDCREIMQQLAAIQAALHATSRSFVQDYATLCLAQMDGTASPDLAAQRAQMVQDMIALLAKAP